RRPSTDPPSLHDALPILVLPTTVEAGTVNEKPPTGCIGVGTWNTAAEFKDIKVTAPGGKVLFTSDFSEASGTGILPVSGAQDLSDRKSTRLNSSHEWISY